MQSDHLAVPDLAPQNSNGFSGRPRSGSTRSQRSQQTENSDFAQTPSIRIRRAPSYQPPPAPSPGGENAPIPVLTEGHHVGVGRNRSVSAPQNMVGGGGGSQRRGSYMPDLAEEITSSTTRNLQDGTAELPAGDHAEGPTNEQTVNEASVSSWRPLRRARTNIGRAVEQPRDDSEYESELVDILDLVDPEVSTLQTLTNVQNSLVIPYLGRYLNRRPTYVLTRRPADLEESESASEGDAERPKAEGRPTAQRMYSGGTINTITSRVNDKYYAVLPHGVSLPGWSEEEKLELNDHVRHMLHSKRSKFKRGLKGFGQYIKKPLGFFVTVYATLITLFGLIWVLFLIGWISVGGRRDYIVNVIDNVLVALFAIIGDGLAPFRAVDTYHMCFIAHYHRLTWRLRREKSLPNLSDNNDLPAVPPDQVSDAEKQEFSVLSPEQQKRLAHHQKKFARSHSFYKPHETATHHAFPLRLLIVVVVLLDCHSLLQIALGTCTWAISYHTRPFALTTVILCCSIACNISAGIVISVGDHKTRKRDVLERIFRQELTASAMKKVEKKRGIMKHSSGTENSSEDQMWGAVDEEAEEIERGGRSGNIGLESMSEGTETEMERERRGSGASSSPEVSYVPIQTGVRQLPRITTTTTRSGDGLTTTTTTHVR